ncbi:PqiB family protein [Paracraurococcus lichenis]|uniref:MlaD family protein n=1 Tax=Paracraurococcus lichenis TaxID=3064888 RepID=A0ABT9DXQ0_9PROT|nr:MlaD family protein [Paracraurococcus sp. LOR1-02]MDO9708666.1 MlaD family protein [Paracraurococcus sp. LOR1-02]
MSGHDAMPEARLAPRGRWSLIWLIPVVAAGIAGWLAWRTLSQRGPEITITFQTGDGLTAGQTKVRHKAVELGTVEGVRLTENLDHVVATLRMSRDAEPFLTDRARFWVVRPRVTAGNVSGLETLVSGAFIELDPGQPGGTVRRAFTGLDSPPGVRSGEPGRTVHITADRIGSLASGSPIFYRDITVGEVLGYDLPDDGRGPVTINAFVRAPYDRLINGGTHFWNASGVAVRVGAEGVRVELESLQAVLAGGIAFEDSVDGQHQPAPEDGRFRLYRSQEEARAAGYRQRVAALAYFDSAARGLAPGAPVEMLGIQIGTVTEVGLTEDLARGQRPRVRVRIEIQPERFMGPDAPPPKDVPEAARRLVAGGLRARLASASLLTGQQLVALDFNPAAPPAEPGFEGEVPVLPTAGGGLDDLTSSLTSIADKVNALPLDRLAADLGAALRAATGTMEEAQGVLRQANQGLAPAMAELPRTLARMNEALTRATALLGSAERGYGQDSAVRREAQRMLEQANDAARSIRLLADFLNRHPEALLRGRSGEAFR